MNDLLRCFKTVIWAALLVVAYLQSHGAPICEGPVIRSVNESAPLQCDDPIDALPLAGFYLYLLGLVPALILAAILQGVDDRRSVRS